MRTQVAARWLLSCVVVGAWSAAAPAEDVGAARTCTALSDAGARLACYDAAFARLPAPASAPSAAPPATTPPASPPADFGDNGQLVQEARAKAKLPRKMDAKVITATEMRGGLYRLTLDNAQIWVTHEGNPALQFSAGDNVTVTRMAFGGYQISYLGRGTSVGAQRIQ